MAEHPNFNLVDLIAVDFYNRGDVLDVVERLNAIAATDG